MPTPPSAPTPKTFTVPQLDEDSLGALPQPAARNGDTTTATTDKAGSGGAGNGFSLVADGVPGFSGTTSNTNNSGVYGNGSNPPSPTQATADAGAVAYLQQQQQAAAVAAAAAQLERDYYYTQMLLQQSPRPILLAVLTSLMEDFPTTLISPIKVRLEHFISANTALKSNMMAMNSLGISGAHLSSSSPLPGTPTPTSPMSHSQRRTSAAAFVPNTNAAPWTPPSQQQQQQGGTGISVATTPYSNAHSPSHSRSNTGGGGGKGKGKGGKEEQEMCSIHHSKRAMKHLQLNADTGLYECIHGFHCLVDEPVAPKRATGVAASASPERGTAANSAAVSAENTLGSGSSGGGFTVVGADKNEKSALEGSDACIGGRALNGAASAHKLAGGRFIDPVIASGYPGVGLSLRPGSGSSSGLPGGRGDGSSPADEELLAYTLKLLQSVRDIEEE